MRIIHAASELGAANQKVCLAIGVFDGVHLGHQQIIRQTISDAHQHEATALILTFDRHPNAVVAPDHVPPMIFSLAQKLRAIESLGAGALLLTHFDRAFSEQTGEVFVRSLARDLGRIQSLWVGADFTFGHKRSGNVTLLKSLGTELGFIVHGLAAVSLDGRVVSSTRIREAIRAGDLEAAGQMLGRSYSMCGPIIKGDRLGHQIGFPTANLDVTGLVLPPSGVYTANAVVLGKSHRSVLNIGHRPTLRNPTPELRVEVHLLDFEGELYGQEMEIRFTTKLRDEKKFESTDQLRAQIARDIADAKRQF